MSTQSRVAAGVPTGGQFSTSARAESGVTLAAAPIKAERRESRTRRGVIVPSDAAYAVGRFNPHGPSGYRAKDLPDAPLRATREEAENDWLDARAPQPSAQPSAQPTAREALAPALSMNRVQAENHVKALIEAAAADGDPQRIDDIATLAAGAGWKGVAYVRGYPSGGGSPECEATDFLPTRAAATRTAVHAWARFVAAERRAADLAAQARQTTTNP